MDNQNALVELIAELGDKISELKTGLVKMNHEITEMAEGAESNRGVLSYNLPQNESEMRVAMNGSKYLLVLYELDMWCRNIVKYDPKDEPLVIWAKRKYDYKEPGILLDDLRDKIRELMRDEGVSLEDGE